MTFDTWITYVDSAMHHAKQLHERLTLDETPPIDTNGRTSIENLCRRFLEDCPPNTLLTRPKDVMPFEWDDAPYAILVARLQSLYDATTARSTNVQNWLAELRIATDDYQKDWAWFNAQIER